MMVKSMKSKIINLVLLFYTLNVYNLSAQTLSPEAEISVLTLGPGKTELYSAYGHSAIRVNDPVYGYDAASPEPRVDANCFNSFI